MANIEGFEFSDDLYYEKYGSFLWGKVEGENVKIGITQFGLTLSKDIIYMELPSVGDTVKQGEAFGVVETVKAVGELYSLVSGEVTQINEGVLADPGTLRESPYKNWLIDIRASNLNEELKNLMNVEKAKEYYSKEIKKAREDGLID